MDCTIKNLPAWLEIYVSPKELLVKIEPRSFRPDTYAIQIGLLHVHHSMAGNTASIKPLYSSHFLDSKKLSLRQAEEVLSSIQKHGRIFFEESGDPTKVMLQHCEKLTKTMVLDIMKTLSTSEVGAMVNCDGKVQPEKLEYA